MKVISRDAVNNVLRVLAEYERGIVDGPERDPGLTLLQQQRHMIRATAFEEVMQALLLVPDVFDEYRTEEK